jgi:hypothetical protein
MQCPTCGQNTPGTLNRCAHCDAPLSPAPPTSASGSPRQGPSAPGSLPGELPAPPAQEWDAFRAANPGRHATTPDPAAPGHSGFGPTLSDPSPPNGYGTPGAPSFDPADQPPFGGYGGDPSALTPFDPGTPAQPPLGSADPGFAANGHGGTGPYGQPGDSGFAANGNGSAGSGPYDQGSPANGNGSAGSGPYDQGFPANGSGGAGSAYDQGFTANGHGIGSGPYGQPGFRLMGMRVATGRS